VHCAPLDLRLVHRSGPSGFVLMMPRVLARTLPYIVTTCLVVSCLQCVKGSAALPVPCLPGTYSTTNDLVCHPCVVNLGDSLSSPLFSPAQASACTSCSSVDAPGGPGCALCSVFDGSCTTCRHGYQLTASGTCEACPAGKWRAGMTSGTSATCIPCGPGHYRYSVCGVLFFWHFKLPESPESFSCVLWLPLRNTPTAPRSVPLLRPRACHAMRGNSAWQLAPVRPVSVFDVPRVATVRCSQTKSGAPCVRVASTGRTIGI